MLKKPNKVEIVCKKVKDASFQLANSSNKERNNALKLISNQLLKSIDKVILANKKDYEIAKKNKHTFISTGMSTKHNIDKAVEIFKKNNCSFELMHCVSTYPMKIEDANLITINQLKKEYNCNVGYSGHENGVVISLAAVMLGITSLERHITLDRTMYGSDQSASLEFSGMKNLIESISKILLSLGEPSLGKIIDDEIPIAKKLRAHIKN